MNKGFDESRPLGSLTIGDFFEMLDEHYACALSGKATLNDAPQNVNLVYGIRGIERLFNVSHRTAQTYKDTFLKPAVSQNGRKIVVDRDLALKLFAEHEEKGGKR